MAIHKVDVAGTKVPYGIFAGATGLAAVGAGFFLYNGRIAIGGVLALLAAYGGYATYQAFKISEIIEQDVKDESRARSKYKTDTRGIHVPFLSTMPKSRKVYANLLGRDSG